ncbi:hypothetical protein SAMN05216266_11140 [Amycolatopsis marina]|uniref:Uncharacterized protein n=1 Tax=Amycolatopsis marina TaxID=490629 RepID=A0A1I1AXY8_9PSEU|nr:hypothetical protein SAMN05216266_11140 [Amycolatopsis marina]
MLLPWLTAKFLFKPRVGPLRKDRILDRLAFWRSVVGMAVIMATTYRYQEAWEVPGKNLLKALQTGALALLLPPLSFLVILVVTRPGRRTRLLPGARRLLGRAALALISFFLPFLLIVVGGANVNITNPHPGAAVVFILAIPLMIASAFWFYCFWCCTIYWAARTGFWTGEIHPLLAPIGTTVLMLLISGAEIIWGGADTVPHPLWLTLNLCGIATALVLAFSEYRHLRASGYRLREGPEPVISRQACDHPEEPATPAGRT